MSEPSIQRSGFLVPCSVAVACALVCGGISFAGTYAALYPRISSIEQAVGELKLANANDRASTAMTSPTFSDILSANPRALGLAHTYKLINGQLLATAVSAATNSHDSREGIATSLATAIRLDDALTKAYMGSAILGYKPISKEEGKYVIYDYWELPFTKGSWFDTSFPSNGKILISGEAIQKPSCPEKSEPILIQGLLSRSGASSPQDLTVSVNESATAYELWVTRNGIPLTLPDALQYRVIADAGCSLSQQAADTADKPK